MERESLFGFKLTLEESSRFIKQRGKEWDAFVEAASHDIGGGHPEYSRTVLFPSEDLASRFQEVAGTLEPPVVLNK